MLNEQSTSAAEVSTVDPAKQHRREVRAKLKASVKESAEKSRAARLDRVAKGRDSHPGPEAHCKWASRFDQLAYAYWRGKPSIMTEPVWRRGPMDPGCDATSLTWHVGNRIIKAGAAFDADLFISWLVKGRAVA